LTTAGSVWPGRPRRNPFPYVAEIQDDPKQFSKQVPLEQLFGDIGSEQVPAFAYIVPDQCRDMHGLSNPLAPCGGASDTDDNDVKRGDDETGWLVDAITGSPVWEDGRNAILATARNPIWSGFRLRRRIASALFVAFRFPESIGVRL
jgi:hypothetical protein